ncbi:hypothetical protein CCR95_11155 [Thiocystis minor]|uniref:hypothetical protein n=1 Tax=Thiocystis minor TaxID=61597 RepID=UPI001913D98C|nr:hypothetical protein [Thiocystis minor]MBK5964621.1 hypothetical protein [Thiocystis minor]
MMSALELGSLILAVEFALVAWAILFFLLRRQRQQLHSDQTHAGAAIEKLAKTETSRRDDLTALFQSNYQLEGEELAARVDEYVAREKAFYNAMLSLYLERDGAKLKDIPAELTKVLSPWTNLTPSGLVPAGELDHLESEKSELAAELESTQRTLDELMQEYSAAFSRSHQPPESAPPQAAPPDKSIADIVIEEEAMDMDQDGFDVRAEEEADQHEFEIADTLAETPFAAPEPEKTAPESVVDSAQTPAHPSGDSDPNDDADEALAWEELEGLADLFEPPSSSKNGA